MGAAPGKGMAEEEFAVAPGRGIPFEVDMLHRRQSESGDAKIRPILGEIDAPAERRKHIDHQVASGCGCVAHLWAERHAGCMITPLGAALFVLPAALSSSPLLSLERIQQDPPLEGRPPMGVQLSPAGGFLTVLRPSAADSEVLDLWGKPLPGSTVGEGDLRVLVKSQDLLGAGTQKLTEQERMQLERRRISKRGITSYQWCGAQDRALLFPLSGDLHLVTWKNQGKGAMGEVVVRPLTRDDDVPEMNPSCSRSGRFVAWVKRGALQVYDTRTGSTRTIAAASSATRSFGLAEFIADEEMDRHTGFFWSPDESSILAFEVDETRVSKKVRPQIFADRTELFEQRYPAAGEANAIVRAFIVDVRSGKRMAIKLPSEAEYVARGGFFPDNSAWIQWQTRDQKKLVLAEVQARGRLREILVETDDAWVELHDNLRALDNGKTLLWSSESSGRTQLWLVDRNSGARRPLTDQAERVVDVVGADDKAGLIFFTGAVERGREQHLFSVSLADRAVRRLTREPGWHAVIFDDTGRFFVDTWSNWARPPQVRLYDQTGRPWASIDDNPARELAAFTAPEPQWLDFRSEDGSLMNGMLLPPIGVDAKKKYPIIAWLYGGPSGQTVHRRWDRRFPLFLHWQQRGYGVFMVDNRGMGARDRAFSRAIHRRLGDAEVKDVFSAVEQLKKRVPWVDGDRIGVVGWSYGGFLASRLVLDEKTPFSAAVAVAPVTDWTLYDTHYTERYLGMPEGGKAVPYASSNLLPRAALLKRPLLIVHGTADDNVLFEHSLRLAHALEDEGALFELAIYPGKAHGIAGKKSQLHVHKTVTSFFDRRLPR